MAKESSISPWVRPSLLGAVAFMTFGVAFLSGLITGVGFNGKGFGLAVMQVMAKVPDGLFSLFEMMFIVYGVGKSGEKMVAHYRGNNEMEKEECQ